MWRVGRYWRYVNFGGQDIKKCAELIDYLKYSTTGRKMETLEEVKVGKPRVGDSKTGENDFFMAKISGRRERSHTLMIYSFKLNFQTHIFIFSKIELWSTHSLEKIFFLAFINYF